MWMVVIGDDKEEIAHLKQCLVEEFEIKDLGTLRYFLGIEVARSDKMIFISQRKYILNLLEEICMLDYKPAVSAIEANRRLQSGIGESLNLVRYQRLVSRLIYPSNT